MGIKMWRQKFGQVKNLSVRLSLRNLAARQVLIIGCFTLCCCAHEKNREEQQIEYVEIQDLKTDDREFRKYLDLLPKVELPFEVNCEACCDHPQIDGDNELIKKFKPEGKTIIGLVSQTKDQAIILTTFSA